MDMSLRCVFLLSVLSSFPALADSHSEGKSFAAEQLTFVSSAAHSPVARTADLNIQNPPQASGYKSGVDLFGQGVSRINSCKTSTKSADRIANQECEAVNFLARNPSLRKKIDISSSDPIIVAMRDVMSNATTSETSETVCIDRTTTEPDEKATEVCHEVSSLNTSSCVLGREVKVDSDSNFQCDATYKALERFTCNKTPAINLNYQPSCTVGAEVRLENASAYLNADKCKGGDKLVFSYVCGVTDTPSIGLRILEGVGGGSYPENGRSLIRLGLPLQVDFEATFSNCKAHVWGSSTCSKGQCSGSYSAAIYVQGYACSDVNGRQECDYKWVLSGTLKTASAFTTYTAVPQQVGWINNCVSLEERSK